ncbi:MAG: isocitrate/isopropylmalate dehydrogenase family protein [Alphaproteobacteria bacterium]
MSLSQHNDTIRFLVLDGDGIGPEIVRSTLTVLDAVSDHFGLHFSFEKLPIGFEALSIEGTSFPERIMAAIPNCDGIILGPVDHAAYPPPSEGGLNPSGELRKRLELFANIRPALSRPGFPPPCGKNVDLVVVRENTEGFYADRSMFLGNGEFMPTPDIAMSLRKITREGSTRVAVAAFELARRRPRKLLTAVHKANVLRIGDGLFLECCREVAKQYPDISYDEKIVDAMAALLIRDSSQFDVIVTTNMFGDILSDQASELSGSLGLAASLNAGKDAAVAQAQHGSAPDIAGQDIANPSSLIGSSAMLLGWLGERHKDQRLIEAAEAIERALSEVIAEPAKRTRDLGGKVGTQTFATHVADALRNQT